MSAQDFLGAILICLPGACVQAAVQAPDADVFHQEIAALYDFLPKDLTEDEMGAKSGLLDVFWSRVESDPAAFAPGLRRELAREDASAFFLYDGSSLLMSLHDAPASSGDARLTLACLARCSLEGIDDTDYLRRVHALASAGNDTTAAALHVLEKASFTAFISQHALFLEKNDCLIYMLMPIDESLYLQPSVDRLRTETEPTACGALLALLWCTATEAGDAAIRQAADDTARPAAVRAAAARRLQASEVLKKGLDAKTIAKAASLADVNADASIAELKAARRQCMQRAISDEALEAFGQITLLIRGHAP